MPTMKNIVGKFILIGLMGSGKTTLGRQLANHFNYSFYDSDHVICERTGVSIPTIFEMEGEQGFRRRESEVIKELCSLDKIILASGGGVVLSHENRNILRNSGVVIYLHSLPHVLFQRTLNDKNRPLLQVADPLLRFQQLYQCRDVLYRETAHIVLNIDSLDNQQDTLSKIIHHLDEFK